MNEIYSISPLDGSKYRVPEGSDRVAIDTFIEAHADRKVVAVLGLGFVGTVMSLVCANSDNDEYAVIGLDRATPDAYWKIGMINSGLLPLSSSDPLVGEFFEKSRESGCMLATHDPLALASADTIIVDINLDVRKSKSSSGDLENYDVPMDGFKAAIRSIGQHCKEDALVLVETTVPPGTCRNVVVPILRNEMESRGLSWRKLRIGHSYERVMPGPNYVNSIKNFFRVYSGTDEVSADSVEKFLRTIISTKEYPLTRLHSTEATEMAKVLENSYRAMNISFAIEWSRLAEAAGVDLYEVVDAIRLRPTHANLMYPGIGVGGYCLTKDPLLASWAGKEFFGLTESLDFSVKAVEKNDRMPDFCFDFFTKEIAPALQSKRVGMLGVAYGPGVGDTRFSPVERFSDLLGSAGYDIKYHDPYVPFWEERLLKIETSLNKFLQQEFDVLVIATGHNDYRTSDHLRQYFEDSPRKPILFDTVGLLKEQKWAHTPKNSSRVFVLGSGKENEL